MEQENASGDGAAERPRGAGSRAGWEAAGGRIPESAQRLGRELRTRVESRLHETMSHTADRLESTAEQLAGLVDERTRGAAGLAGRAGEMAHSLADLMESTANYLRSNEVEGLRDDLRRQLRERPLQTLLIGVAAGWVAGKILR